MTKILSGVEGRNLYVAGRTVLSNNESYPLHDHEYIEVFWIESGKGLHHFNDETIALERGTLWMVRSRDSHGFTAAKGSSLSIMNIGFEASMLSWIESEFYPDRDELWGGKDVPSRRFFLSDEETDYLSRQLTELRGIDQKKRDLLRFLLELFHVLYDKHFSTEPGVPDWLKKALREIRKPEYFRHGPAVFVKLCNKTLAHVSRVLKTATGKRPIDIILQSRMEYAARLLGYSGKEVIEISLECGYKSHGHFYNDFTRYHGISPGKFRKLNQAH